MKKGKRSGALAPRSPARAMPRTAARPREESVRTAADLLRAAVCAVIFFSLVALKLVMPGNLSSVRGTLGTWLLRDADFTEAFSALGRAASGADGFLDSLGEAYVAVFGQPSDDAGNPDDAPETERAPAGTETVPPAETAERVETAERAEVTEAAETPETADTPETAGTAETPEPAADAEELDGAAEETLAVTEPLTASSLLDRRAWPEGTAAEQHILGFSYTAPLEGTLTSPFGWRDHPVSGRESFHYGVDLAAEEGTAIVCFADGTVGAVGESTELGRYLTVSHENGVSTLYAHCSKITVTAGSNVKKGGKLAEVGQTGNATGAHLHFEIRDGEAYLNPIYYLVS